MRLSLVLRNAIRREMSAAVVAGGGPVIARIAIERTAVEKLLQTLMIFRRQIARVARQRHLVATAFAVAAVHFADERRIVIVYAARHGALAIAQRTGHAQLSGDRLTNKGALVGQLVQEFGKLFFDFECNDSRLRSLARHR